MGAGDARVRREELRTDQGGRRGRRERRRELDEVEPGRLGLAVRPLTAEEQRATQTQGGLRVEKATGPSAKAGNADRTPSLPTESIH